MAGIVGFFQALPKLLDLIDRLGSMMQQAAFQKWMQQMDETVGKLEKATTDKERLDAAKNLAQLTRAIR